MTFSAVLTWTFSKFFSEPANSSSIACLNRKPNQRLIDVSLSFMCGFPKDLACVQESRNTVHNSYGRVVTFSRTCCKTQVVFTLLAYTLMDMFPVIRFFKQ